MWKIDKSPLKLQNEYNDATSSIQMKQTYVKAMKFGRRWHKGRVLIRVLIIYYYWQLIVELRTDYISSGLFNVNHLPVNQASSEIFMLFTVTVSSSQLV